MLRLLVLLLLPYEPFKLYKKKRLKIIFKVKFNCVFFFLVLFLCVRADPVPCLELIGPLQTKASRLADVELEVKQLRDTLAEYNEEFRQVRNQGKSISI